MAIFWDFPLMCITHHHYHLKLSWLSTFQFIIFFNQFNTSVVDIKESELIFSLLIQMVWYLYLHLLNHTLKYMYLWDIMLVCCNLLEFMLLVFAKTNFLPIPSELRKGLHFQLLLHAIVLFTFLLFIKTTKYAWSLSCCPP